MKLLKKFILINIVYTIYFQNKILSEVVVDQSKVQSHDMKKSPLPRVFMIVLIFFNLGMLKNDKQLTIIHQNISMTMKFSNSYLHAPKHSDIGWHSINIMYCSYHHPKRIPYITFFLDMTEIYDS